MIICKQPNNLFKPRDNLSMQKATNLRGRPPTNSDSDIAGISTPPQRVTAHLGKDHPLQFYS